MKPITEIRKIAIAKANHLQRCHLHLEVLRPAFAEWAAGEIYVCKKTGTYRYRFGDRSKSVTSWNASARAVFETPEAFAFAAMVLAEPAQEPTPAALPASKVATPSNRVDVIELSRIAAQTRCKIVCVA
jgi:hypothetical protein